MKLTLRRPPIELHISTHIDFHTFSARCASMNDLREFSGGRNFRVKLDSETSRALKLRDYGARHFEVCELF